MESCLRVGLEEIGSTWAQPQVEVDESLYIYTLIIALVAQTVVDDQNVEIRAS